MPPSSPSTTNQDSSNGSAGPPAEPLFPGGLGGGLGGGLSGSTVHTFSARTCLELLPNLSDDQIETEIKHLRALHPSINFRTRNPSLEAKRDLLHKSLTNSLCHEVDSIVNNIDLLLDNISRSVKVSQKHVVDVEQSLHPAEAEDISSLHLSDSGNTTLEEPVRFLDISFSDVTFHDVEQSIVFVDKLSGNRETAYYGSQGYTYDHIKHEPADYPQTPLFDTLFERLQSIDSQCTKENYTCLVTRYPDGNSSIPSHHDDERSIMPGTNIYTVSFGATRTVKFLNVKGPLDERKFELKHGSVHAMTKESQSVWKHGISREPEVTDSRVSFTFRRLVDVPVEEKPTIPPIAPHPSPKSNNKQTRVLLLTDSIHSSTPSFIFDAIPNHVCIKKVNYKLTDIHDGFRDEFPYTDVVIVSCGINDLSRYGHTANSLADIVCRRFKQYSVQYPNTKFIFNSVLLTRDHQWVNTEVRLFNQYMFELSRSTRNMYYFDSDRLVAQCGIRRPYLLQGQGIHVTLDVRKLVTRELANSVGFLAGSRAARFQRCGWLRHVTTRSSWAG